MTIVNCFKTEILKAIKINILSFLNKHISIKTAGSF